MTNPAVARKTPDHANIPNGVVIVMAYCPEETSNNILQKIKIVKKHKDATQFTWYNRVYICNKHANNGAHTQYFMPSWNLHLLISFHWNYRLICGPISTSEESQIRLETPPPVLLTCGRWTWGGRVWRRGSGRRRGRFRPRRATKKFPHFNWSVVGAVT